VQLVGDEDHGSPFGRHLSQGLEQEVRLLRRQHGGRLVENENPRLAIERLQDLDALLLAERELPDPSARLDGEPVALRQLGNAAFDCTLAQTERAPLPAMIAENDVLGHGERLHEPEVLVDHANPRVERVARRVEMHLTAVEEDLAVVWPVEAGEDVRERALAGAVLAEERVHFACCGLELDGVVGEDARKALRDPAHRDCGGRRGAVGTPPVVLGRDHFPVELPITPFTSQFIA